MAAKLNLGCGDRFLAHWTNLDFQPRGTAVRRHDLRTPLPFRTASFEVVYHSHVLEHLSPEDAGLLLRECCRVLTPGGVLRVVVPDLEQKAVVYLEKLQAAAHAPTTTALAEHSWTVVELIDQLVRTRSGGRMLDFIRSGQAAHYVAQRIGDEYARGRAAAPPRSAIPDRTPSRERTVRGWVHALARRVLRLSDSEWDYLQFRRMGELHLWMYDRVSLAAALREAGFVDPRVETAASSRIANWEDDGLFLDGQDGSARKPDSLYMEAQKP